MKKAILLALAIAFALVAYPAKSQRKTEELFLIKKQTIDSLVDGQMIEQHIIGLSLGIVIEGKLIVAKGYGLSNIEHHILASEETVYKIGSVSKQMVAAAIMLFIQNGKLRLNDSLTMFFKGAPESWNKITVRHLLNHTSGLPRDSPALDNMKIQPDSVLIKATYTSRLLFEPGTSWRYCNLGYFMLADIIRQLSGQSFADYMENAIFKNKDLLQTKATTFSGVVNDKATGYVYKGPGSVINAKDYLALRPSGAFISSINDLIKWEMLIQHDKLLKKESWSKMWTDVVRTSSKVTQNPVEYYGYGWDINEYKGLKAVHHDGTLPGFTSSYFRFIDNKSAIIILTNADNAYPRTIALGIADILFKEGAKKKPAKRTK